VRLYCPGTCLELIGSDDFGWKYDSVPQVNHPFITRIYRWILSGESWW
jgi:hypothetical protein